MPDRVVLVTDTTACIPPQLVARYGIEIVPIVVLFGDKQYLDTEMTPSQFYDMLRQSKELPTTAGSIPGPSLQAFERASRHSSGILCLTEPEKFSGMYNAAVLAKELAAEKLPGLRIEVLPSTTAAAGLGLLVLAAARAAESGASLAEVSASTLKLMERIKLFASLETLDYLIKGGRIPKVASLADSVFQIKPVFSINGGDAHIVALPRTPENAMRCILRLMAKNVRQGTPLHVAVMHAEALERAEKLKAQIMARFQLAEIFITEFTPVMGVHTGPGVIGVAFYSEE